MGRWRTERLKINVRWMWGRSTGWAREKGRALLEPKLEGGAGPGRDPRVTTQGNDMGVGRNFQPLWAGWGRRHIRTSCPHRLLGQIMGWSRGLFSLLKKCTLSSCEHESHTVLKSEPVRGCSREVILAPPSFIGSTQEEPGSFCTGCWKPESHEKSGRSRFIQNLR